MAPLKQFHSGMTLIAYGFFKKVVVADNLSLLVNEVYARPGAYGPMASWAAVFFFSFQIYGDFSGYTDIARGCSRIFGVELMKNFDCPYFAASISEFWRRWHISLSTWFRDYVYLPLGGSRRSNRRVYLNLFIVFFLSGFWHGAAWTFVIWGVLHWFFLAVSRSLDKRFVNFFPVWTRQIFCFLLVSLAWIFFRANSFRSALAVLQSLFARSAMAETVSTQIGSIQSRLLEGSILIGLLLVLDFTSARMGLYEKITRLPTLRRRALYASFALFLLIAGEFNSRQFIYFQF
jgi:alginate O-acetyltransferase complex protein AlgI